MFRTFSGDCVSDIDGYCTVPAATVPMERKMSRKAGSVGQTLSNASSGAGEGGDAPPKEEEEDNASDSDSNSDDEGDVSGLSEEEERRRQRERKDQVGES